MILIYGLSVAVVTFVFCILFCAIAGFLAKRLFGYQNFALFPGLAMVLIGFMAQASLQEMLMTETSGKAPYLGELMGQGLALVGLALYWLVMLLLDLNHVEANWKDYLLTVVSVLLFVLGTVSHFMQGLTALGILALLAILLQQGYYHVLLKRNRESARSEK